MRNDDGPNGDALSAAAAKPVVGVPVAQGLFTWSAAATHLIGSRCRGCGTHYFPKSLSCRNPRCAEKVVEEVLLGPRGRLFSFTAQSYRPPALFKMEPWAPYVIALVELPQGLRVMGMLTATPPDLIRIGMELNLTVEPLYRDAEGRDVLTYKFEPVRGAA